MKMLPAGRLMALISGACFICCCGGGACTFGLLFSLGDLPFSFPFAPGADFPVDLSVYVGGVWLTELPLVEEPEEEEEEAREEEALGVVS